MHQLSAHSEEIHQSGETIDLKQSPADIIFASFADSELAALAEVIDGADINNIRLVNIAALSNHHSVNLWLEKTAQFAKLIVVRLLGGISYWQYGIDKLLALTANKNIKLVLLPGDAIIDPALLERSNIAQDEWQFLHQAFVTGGQENMSLALKAFALLASDKPIAKQEIKPFARFGVYLPQHGVMGVTEYSHLTLRQAQDEAKSGAHSKHIKPHPEPVKGRGANKSFIPIIFYRAALEGGGTKTLEQLIKKLKKARLTPIPIMISTLKEGACIRFVKQALKIYPPEIILNLTGFSLGIDGIEEKQNPFANIDAPVIQLIQASNDKQLWQDNIQGLNGKDLAMQIVLPEMDGRIGCLIIGHKKTNQWHKKSQCNLATYQPYKKGISQTVKLVKNWVKLRQISNKEKRVALVLANYPIRDGRIANGVGYDAPQSSVEILNALQGKGYSLGRTSFALQQDQGKEEQNTIPKNGNELIKLLQNGPTNAKPKNGKSKAILSLKTYQKLLRKLPKKIQNDVNKQWGEADKDEFHRQDGFHLPIVILGNIAIVLQPARGFHLDIEANYHDPDLVPPHAYLATYLWIKYIFKTNALIHNGKHGNLEWLPGKATALKRADYPLALWGALPHFYPFIVNDPGEGTQAKRRTGAVIIDHLVPPLTRAETYGPLKDLESLLDEYYMASGMDQRRLIHLKKRILDFAKDAALDKDIDLAKGENEALGEIDNYLCELKEAQIRDGLHIFGQSPTGELEHDLIVALARVPRGENIGDASFIRVISKDLKLGFDPLSAKLGDEYKGPKPDILKQVSSDIWRSNGDAIERLEILALTFVRGEKLPESFVATKAVIKTINEIIRPRLRACGENEINSLIDGLNGKFIMPGSSGAPSRGRLDVLPTGRNFYSVDNRSVPTQVAWELGQKSAENLLHRHFHDEGKHLKSVALSVWGTSNMRTGGDDIAQALALIGAKPKWDFSSLRVNGFEIIPLAKLGRPRVDVTLRISGFFRDAFPQLITLFDRAIRAIGALDEPVEQNPIAKKMTEETQELIVTGLSESEATLKAGYRIFGSKPGSYGAGLQGLMDSNNWQDKVDLSKAFLNWGQYAYGAKSKGIAEKEQFSARLKNVEALVHNQDNREHDLLDSDDYYQFEGGLFASIETLKGTKPKAYHNDHSRPENPKIRTLEEEISFTMRSRVTNPKWIKGVMRHGYKGAFEIIASVDYMFAFAATTGAVKSHHFDMAFEAFILDRNVANFIKQNNEHGYAELKTKLNEAIKRGFWQPKSNSAHVELEE